MAIPRLLSVRRRGRRRRGDKPAWTVEDEGRLTRCRDKCPPRNFRPPFTDTQETCDTLAAGEPAAGQKKAAPCGAAEFREETSKKGSKRITALLRCTI